MDSTPLAVSGSETHSNPLLTYSTPSGATIRPLTAAWVCPMTTRSARARIACRSANHARSSPVASAAAARAAFQSPSRRDQSAKSPANTALACPRELRLAPGIVIAASRAKPVFRVT